MTLTAKLSLDFTATHTGANDFGGPDFEPRFRHIANIANGTGDDQADILWMDERTIAASGSEDLDLAGALTDAFGSTITAVEIVGIIIDAAAGNTNDVVVGNGSQPVINGPFGGDGTQVINVKPGGLFVWFAPDDGDGIPVTATSADDLGVANSSSGTGVTYRIAILARSA